MNKHQILQQELEKLKAKRLQEQLRAKQSLLLARENAEFCQLDNQMRTLKLQLSKESDSASIEKLKLQITALKNKANKVLIANNIDPSDLEPKFECKLCKDMGLVDGLPCECVQRRLQKILIKQSGVNNHLKFNFGNCDAEILKQNATLEKAYKLAYKFVEEFPKYKFNNLIFIGDVGTGKTFLLECIASALIEKNNYVFFTTAFDINKTMLNAFGAGFNERETIISPLFECDLLIIDDLGSEPILKNVTISNLFTIINERQRLNLPTIISTNLTPQEIQVRYGDRINSRIFNKRICATIPFVGSDLRLKK